MTRKLVICDCYGSQKLDPETIEKGSGLICSKLYSSLCADQMAEAAKEMAEGNVIFACQQERVTFEELAAETEVETPGFVDLRDRAGWGEGEVAPKMAALAAEAALSIPMGKSVDVVSEGTCLIIGDEPALQAAAQLCDTLAVTVLLSDASLVPTDRRFDAIVGTLARASGALGQFKTQFDALQQIVPGGRGSFTLTPPQDGAVSQCDIILDLSGSAPLFPAHEKREGYLRADPTYLPAISEAVITASQLVGTFKKPLYVRMETTLCAHSRAEKPACSNCLNICPTGAITSAGEHVTVDPMVCAGCGACSAVCPSGAISYDAPPVEVVFRRISTLASAYAKAGGVRGPRLLVHDEVHGREMIELAARFGRGLPADVIPLEMEALASFGHAEVLAALGVGFSEVMVLASPKSDREVINAQLAVADRLAGGATTAVIEPVDPDALCDLLYGPAPAAPSTSTSILPLGTRRQVTRLAAKALNPQVDIIDLPEGAPYGAIVVDTDACTLCLSCVSLCPSGALGDNQDLPQLRFQEDACLQCGLCSNICPEKAITLKPQLDLTDAALTQKVLHEEEPFACIECGALFGTKSTVERITEKLAGNHAMFANSEAAKMIQMCDNCRVQAQYHAENSPFAQGERPKVRTTEDYLSKRRDH